MALANYRLNWNDVPLKEKVSGVLIQRMELAGVYLQGEVRKKINRGNAGGHSPSAPGEPPKKVSAQLFDSIAVSPVHFDGTTLRVLVGSNKVYARRLELGFYGTDSLGRNYQQEPRPFLRPTLYSNTMVIAKIVATGRK